jgi:branched-subunit amino acid transport protein
MSTEWVLIGVLAVINFAIKATGPVLAGRRELPERVHRFISVSVFGLVAALVVTGTFGDGKALVLDARAAGMAAALGCVLLRAPMLVVMLAAASVTALLRAV